MSDEQLEREARGRMAEAEQAFAPAETQAEWVAAYARLDEAERAVAALVGAL